jgi:hypothetical protein
MGKCKIVQDTQRDHIAAEHQVTEQESLPQPTHRHPDNEEVPGSSPRGLTRQGKVPIEAMNQRKGRADPG